MQRRKHFVFAVAVLSVLIFGGVTFAQQELSGDTSAVPDVQWLWGEAVSVDAAKGEVVVKFLDYETEQEKQVTVAIDDKTTFENVNSLAQIKTADTLSIDYVVDKDGKNLAKAISVEKPEEVNMPDMGTTVEPPVENSNKVSTDTEQPSQEPVEEAPVMQ